MSFPVRSYNPVAVPSKVVRNVLSGAGGDAEDGLKGATEVGFGATNMVLGVATKAISESLGNLFQNAKRLRAFMAIELVLGWCILATSEGSYPDNGIVNLTCTTVGSDGARSIDACEGFGQWSNIVATGILVWAFFAGAIFNFKGRDLGELSHAGGILANQWVTNGLLWGVSLGMLEANTGSADLSKTILMVLLGLALAFLCWNRHRSSHVLGNTTSLGDPGFILAAVSYIVAVVLLSIEFARNADNLPSWAQLQLWASIICIGISIFAIGYDGESDQESTSYEKKQRTVHVILFLAEAVLLHFTVWTYIKGAHD